MPRKGDLGIKIWASKTMKNSKVSRFPNSPPPKPMAFRRRPLLLATYGALTRGLQDPVGAAGPDEASHSRRSTGGGLRPAPSAATRGPDDPERRPLHRPQPAARRAWREPRSRHHPESPAAPLLTTHCGGWGGPAGRSGLGAIFAGVPLLRPPSPLQTRSGQPRAGPAPDHVAPPPDKAPAVGCLRSGRPPRCHGRVAMATADAHVCERQPCWGVRSLS